MTSGAAAVYFWDSFTQTAPKRPLMKLTDIERKSILAAQLRADAPIAQIAELAGHREHTVRRALLGLQARGVIRRYVFIDAIALGLKCYTILFSFSGSRAEREQLVELLEAHSMVCWLNETTGEYQFIACLSVVHSKDVVQFLNDLSIAFGQKIYRKALAERVNGSLYPRTYLGKIKRPDAPLLSELCEPVPILDELDHKILSALAHFEYRSYAELSRKLSLPSTTLNNRMNRLRELKIILASCYAVHCSHFDYECFYFLVHTKGINAASKAKLRHYFEKHPNIFSCVETLGDWDFECGAELPDATSATELVGALNEAFPDLITLIKVFPLADRSSKASYYPLLGNL